MLFAFYKTFPQKVKFQIANSSQVYVSSLSRLPQGHYLWSLPPCPAVGFCLSFLLSPNTVESLTTGRVCCYLVEPSSCEVEAMINVF